MIEVIGHRDDIKHEVTCAGCGSILSYRRPDVKHSYDPNGRGIPFRYIDCPVCKAEHAANPNIENIGRVRVTLPYGGS